MKTWKAIYDWSGSWGAFEEKYYIIIAETKEVALGLALEAEPETAACNWTIELINNERAEAHYMTGRCS